ncbi:MAG: energy-coupling factor transporter transmembrane protein EcfT [Spirochaetes bacterium]|nr:MAG: energy-coupling factor transporter transmembrane protein EcfT [Spirochaetota bacterium]RKX81839.1 MAG: energy-coupling factor transporter transmembrane protein EcfT [Spirochaetota bacterium]RKX95996.1 MAG: energy-coupling factor transporter transmembrane protein EcfT [Spirochaetota bacterium]
MDMFLYVDIDSRLHRLDARTKLILMFLSFTVAVMFLNIVVLGSLLVLVVAYGASGRILGNLKRIKVVIFMITLFSLAIWSIARPSDSKVFIFSLEGLFYGIMIALKTNTMIIAGMIFLSTTKIEEIAEGLVKLKVPYRGAFAFATAIRLVPMIVATSYTIIQAQKSRGLDLDSGNILQKTRKYLPLMIPTFISVIRSTNIFSMALESKGFGYSKNRTNYLNHIMGGKDYFMLFLGVLILASAIVMKKYPGLYDNFVLQFSWSEFAVGYPNWSI